MIKLSKNSNEHGIKFLVVLLISFFIMGFYCGLAQDNPVLAPDVSPVPIVDGVGDDLCWQNIPWQSIDQVWIPYGESVDSEDYSGRYKVVWSATTNLLYFLVEVTDDMIVDGFVFGVTSDIYNFDIAEVFIDEDMSGGLHIFDGKGADGPQYGTNAENAFTYHIYADFPDEGQVTTNGFVADLDGTNWSDSRTVNYAAHFPAFALRLTGHTAVWEFSLIVYNDTYEDNNRDAARAQLAVGKEMGLSLAYCDNDDPDENPKVRDNMFGSVWEPSPGNMHWMNADYFGRVKLVSDVQSVAGDEQAVQANTLRLYPNPASSSSQLQLDNSYLGEVTIRLFNILGQEVLRTAAAKTDRLFRQTLSLDHFPVGLYFLQTQMGKTALWEKLLITDKK